MDKELTIREALSQGYKFAKEHLWFFIGYLLIMFLYSFPFYYIANHFMEREKYFSSFVTHLINTTLSFFFSMGLYNSALLVISHIKPSYKQLVSNGHHFVSWIAANLLFGLMIFFGLLFFVIPGFYLMSRYALYPFFLLDKNLTAIEALKAASKASEGKRWYLFLLMMSVLLINLLGALLFGVGLFFTIPLTILTFAVVYQSIVGEGTTSLIR